MLRNSTVLIRVNWEERPIILNATAAGWTINTVDGSESSFPWRTLDDIQTWIGNEPKALDFCSFRAHPFETILEGESWKLCAVVIGFLPDAVFFGYQGFESFWGGVASLNDVERVLNAVQTLRLDALSGDGGPGGGGTVHSTPGEPESEDRIVSTGLATAGGVEKSLQVSKTVWLAALVRANMNGCLPNEDLGRLSRSIEEHDGVRIGPDDWPYYLWPYISRVDDGYAACLADTLSSLPREQARNTFPVQRLSDDDLDSLDELRDWCVQGAFSVSFMQGGVGVVLARS